MSVRKGAGRPFSPLDRKLKLRSEQWSEGAAQLAAERGLQSQSFAQGAQSFVRSVGEEISADSVRRMTEGFGERVARARAAEVEQVYALESDPRMVLSGAGVQQVEPIGGQGNISTDGTLILIRGEGWKEVKLTVISQVEVRPARERPPGTRPREGEPRVRLHKHSCQAGLWEADTMGRYQYVEGLRRGLQEGQRLSSVNDAAAWIERITAENFPQAVQIVDWSHAEGHLWQVAHEVFGEDTPQGRSWAEAQQERLWQGRPLEVAEAIGALPAQAAGVHQAQGYFQSNHSRMQYDRYRAAGYPIGSGTVESGGKNYVQYRLKRPGRGWNRDQAQSMLAALCEMHSNRFDHAWQRFT